MIKTGTRARPSRRAFDTWQIIYIDLMTNVMIFFVILWAIQNRTQKTGISDTIGTETVKMVNLPGDVLFASGQSKLSSDGQQVLYNLFADDSGTVLSFDSGPLTKRELVIHGHTDGTGDKEKNLDLGYWRALSAYREIRKYGKDVPDHVVICTHADNTPAEEVPAFGGMLTASEQQVVKGAQAKNRRITIEDKLVSKPRGLEGP
jgi:outer membrane protein OmpA-like peptidoglycan-associated protein